MGDFGKSFKKELGKATGRRVANAVFGDKHASKHKVTIQREREERRKEREVIKAEKEFEKELRREQREQERQQREYEREQKRAEIEERKKLRADLKAQKEEEREYKRWLKEQERLEREEIKNSNLEEAESFSNYISVIQEIHTVPVDRINWDEYNIDQDESSQPKSFDEYYNSEIKEYDTLFDAAAKLVIENNQGSASLLQRKLKIGYNRAGKLFDLLESNGVIGEFNNTGAREVLVDKLIFEAARVIIDEQKGSAALLQRKLKVDYEKAGIIIDQLERHKVIGPFNGNQTREVLLTSVSDMSFFKFGGSAKQCVTGGIDLTGEFNQIPTKRPEDKDEEFLDSFLLNKDYWRLKNLLNEFEEERQASLNKCDSRVIGENLKETKKLLEERVSYYEGQLYRTRLKVKELEVELTKLKGSQLNKLFSKSRIKELEARIAMGKNEYIKKEERSVHNHKAALEILSKSTDYEDLIENILAEWRSLKKTLDNWSVAWEKAHNDKSYVDKVSKIANGISNFEPESYSVALELFGGFEFASDFGSSLEVEFDKREILVDFFVNIHDVVPQEKKTYTQAGKLSSKPFSDTERNLIVQDYVCSSVLRIAKEAFAILPIDTVVINAIDKIINTSTGILEDAVLIASRIDRNKFEVINLNLIDPSDAIEGFEHNMKFSKSNGFKPVENLNLNKSQTKTSPKKSSKEIKKQVLKETESIKSKSIDPTCIRFSSSLTVLDIQNQFKELFDKKVIVLTPKGNAAGENRKLRALTDKDLKTEIIVPIEKLTKKALKEVKKITGIHIDY